MNIGNIRCNEIVLLYFYIDEMSILWNKLVWIVNYGGSKLVVVRIVVFKSWFYYIDC